MATGRLRATNKVSKSISYPDILPTTKKTVTLTTGTGSPGWTLSTNSYWQDVDLEVEYDLSTTLIKPDMAGQLVTDNIGWTPYNSGGTTLLRFWTSGAVSGTWPTHDIVVAITEGCSYVQYVWGTITGLSGGSINTDETIDVTAVPGQGDGNTIVTCDHSGDLRGGQWETLTGAITASFNNYMLDSDTITTDLYVTTAGTGVKLPFTILRW